jgi:hypothetical protein
MRDIVSEIIRRVSDERRLVGETITSGIGVNNFEQYQRMIGRAEGYALALDVINDVLSEDDES